MCFSFERAQSIKLSLAVHDRLTDIVQSTSKLSVLKNLVFCPGFNFDIKGIENKISQRQPRHFRPTYFSHSDAKGKKMDSDIPQYVRLAEQSAVCFAVGLTLPKHVRAEFL